MVTCSFAEMMLGGVCDGHRKPIKTQGFAANAPVARYAKECNRYERRRLLQVFRLLQCFCVFDDAFKLGESAQMWSQSAIPRVATCFEDEEIIHFDLSHFLCLARTDKQMVGRTSFNHVQTPLTFDNASRILFFAGRTSFGSTTVSCLGHHQIHQRRREKPSEISTGRETSRGLEECTSLGVACHPMLPLSQSILRGGTWWDGCLSWHF